nr:serine/arginine repetitive matrix protein 2 [Oryctolagus cuniculus]
MEQETTGPKAGDSIFYCPVGGQRPRRSRSPGRRHPAGKGVSGGGGRVLGATHAGPPPTAKPRPRIRGWGKPEFESGPGQTRNFGVSFARLSRRPAGPGFETSTCFRSPPSRWRTARRRSPDLALGSPECRAPTRAKLAGGRARVSLWVAESPWCGQGTHVAFREAPRRPTGHQDRVGATGAGQLISFSCSSRHPANTQNTSPPVSHPGASRLATGQVAEPRKQATRRQRKRTCRARTETESTAWLEKASGTRTPNAQTKPRRSRAPVPRLDRSEPSGLALR